jgi:hypothetical protein
LKGGECSFYVKKKPWKFYQFTNPLY